MPEPLIPIIPPALRLPEFRPVAPVTVHAPAEGIDKEARAERARAALGSCGRQLCFPALPGSEPTCWCWSDIIVYTAAVGMILVGSWSMFLSRR